MGTNYYVNCRKAEPCKTCGHVGFDDVELHIGKSSGGWAFALNVHPQHGINSFEDWVLFLAERQDSIFNEYGDNIPLHVMIGHITKRSYEKGLKRQYTEGPGWMMGGDSYDIAQYEMDFC